jgi:tRNA(Ile)-lysidine synthase
LRLTPLQTAVAAAVERAGRPAAGQTVVVALSGGADSVALLDALLTLGSARGFRVVAAHLDHRLRRGSAADAAFCRRLCRDRGVPLRTGTADVRARARREGGGIEEAARLERYAFLRRVKESEGAALIALAHTRDDQAETFLLRLVRGSGRAGLACMRVRSGDLFRPLLAVGRAEVVAHLRARGLRWREDPTNADTVLLRNRVRRELLPYLEARFNPAIRETLARAAGVLADETDVLERLARRLFRRARVESAHGVTLSRPVLSAAPRALARLAIRHALAEAGGLRGVGAVHVERILGLVAAEAPSGRRLPLPGGREAVFHFEEVRLDPRRKDPTPAAAHAPYAVELPVPGRVALPGGGTVEARAARGPAGTRGDATVVAAPAGTLVVRTRRAGDRVRLGGREVSLKRFLMDRRVPASQRASLPLVAAGGRVVWVAGQPPAAAAEPEGRFVRIKLRAPRRMAGEGA